jgi:quercetin dioxygenase-like cupin family protein
MACEIARRAKGDQPMKQWLWIVLLFAVPGLAAPVVTPLANTDRTITGQPIVAPDHPTVIATMLTFAPGERTAIHKHLWPHYGYMLEGVLTVTNTETGQSVDLHAGEFLVEMQNTAHYGENRGSVAVKILIVDTVPAGTTSNSVVVP